MYLDGIIFGIVCELSIHSETSCFVGVIQQKKDENKNKSIVCIQEQRKCIKILQKKYFYCVFIFYHIRFLGFLKKMNGLIFETSGFSFNTFRAYFQAAI